MKTGHGVGEAEVVIMRRWEPIQCVRAELMGPLPVQLVKNSHDYLFIFFKKAQIKNRLDFSFLFFFFNHHRLPGTFWVKLQPSEARVDNLISPPPHLIGGRGGNAAALQRFSRWPKSAPSRSWPSSGLSAISRAARQLKHRAAAAAKLYLTWIRAQLRLGPRTHYCNARVGEGGGEGVMAEPESVSICCGRRSCLLFSMFQLARALLGLCCLTPTESQDGAAQSNSGSLAYAVF